MIPPHLAIMGVDRGSRRSACVVPGLDFGSDDFDSDEKDVISRGSAVTFFRGEGSQTVAGGASLEDLGPSRRRRAYE